MELPANRCFVPHQGVTAKGPQEKACLSVRGPTQRPTHFASGDTWRHCCPRDPSEFSAWSSQAAPWCDLELRTPRGPSTQHQGPETAPRWVSHALPSSPFRLRHWLHSGVSRGTPICADVGETGTQALSQTHPWGAGRDRVHILNLSPHTDRQQDGGLRGWWWGRELVFNADSFNFAKRKVLEVMLVMVAQQCVYM